MSSPGKQENSSSDPANWVDLYGDVLFRYALVRMRDSVLAEDVVQETLLAALQNRKTFESRSTERTWLVGILKHKIIDYFRKAVREEPINDDESQLNIGERDFKQNGRWRIGPAPWKMDSTAILEQNEFWGILRQCLSGLPSRLANAFMLKELEELSSKDVCKVCNISPTNLWVMLHRVRHRLRECLEVNWFGQKPEEG
jgi:RNA polymerase sigma-70 factor (ECF subfamily)